jgi:hypothetical protein
MSGTLDSATALLRAIAARLDAEFELEEICSRSWASATFTGARHELALRIGGDGAGAALSAFLAGLAAAEFELRGHILADIALVSEERRDGEDELLLKLEALTVEDD